MPVFPHSCTITRPNPVDTRLPDVESGQPVGTPPTDLVVYSGRCRLVELSDRARRAEAVMRERGGDTDIAGVAELRLPTGSGPFDHDTDVIAVAANGTTRTARLLRAAYLRRRVVLLITWMTRAAS